MVAVMYFCDITLQTGEQSESAVKPKPNKNKSRAERILTYICLWMQTQLANVAKKPMIIILKGYNVSKLLSLIKLVSCPNDLLRDSLSKMSIIRFWSLKMGFILWPFFRNSATWLLKWKQPSPTHAQIDFQTRGKHSSLLCQMFSVGGFNTDQMATPNSLMILEVSRCWVICSAPHHHQVGPCCWSGGLTWGPFHQLCIYSSLWLPPRPARGLCSVCQACWDGSVAEWAIIHQAPRVCERFALLCWSPSWGVFAEGTKWSRASYSNRLMEHVLCVCVLIQACVQAWVYEHAACVGLLSLPSQINELLHDPFLMQTSTYPAHNMFYWNSLIYSPTHTHTHTHTYVMQHIEIHELHT